jgi:hypothetical protein
MNNVSADVLHGKVYLIEKLETNIVQYCPVERMYTPLVLSTPLAKAVKGIAAGADSLFIISSSETREITENGFTVATFSGHPMMSNPTKGNAVKTD